MTWSGEYGVAAVIASVNLFVLIGGLLIAYFKGVGIREADHKQLSGRFAALENRMEAAESRFVAEPVLERRFTGLEDRVVDLDTQMEQFKAAVNANTQIVREQVSESQRRASEIFATKAEVVALEERNNRGFDRVLEEVRRLYNRIDTLSDAVMKSLQAG